MFSCNSEIPHKTKDFNRWKKEPLFPGAFGIFGHGNVACLGQALEEYQKELPTWRGHEQNMALTGIAYSRAKRRKQIFIATSSVGPGSTNMITVRSSDEQ